MSARGAVRSRLFFGFWPDVATRAALKQCAQAHPVSAGRPITPAQWHLTLAFCGWQSATVSAQLADLEIVSALPVVQVALDRRLFWPEARAFVLEAADPPPSLLSMQRIFQQHLHALGVRVDAQPYRPHVTLVRGMVDAPTGPWVVPLAPPVVWSLDDLVLVASQPQAEGSIYTPVSRWRHDPTVGAFIPIELS